MRATIGFTPPLCRFFELGRDNYTWRDDFCPSFRSLELHKWFHNYSCWGKFLIKLQIQYLSLTRILYFFPKFNPLTTNVTSGTTRTIREICWNLTIRTPEQPHWRRSGVFIVGFEQIPHIVLVFPLLTLNK